jgi:hypothetical protein
MKNKFSTELVIVLALAASVATAQASVLSHTGSVDPASEGFTIVSCCGDSSTAPVFNDQGQNAWSITAGSVGSQYGYYSGALSTEQRADFSTNGAVLSFDARVLKGLAPSFDLVNHVFIVGAQLDTGLMRFELLLGLDGNGDTVAGLSNSLDKRGPGGAIRGFGPSFTLTGSGSSYHNYQLVFDPGLQVANLYIDGVERIQNYVGDPLTVQNVGLGFGVGSGGQGNFANVQLASLSAVPIPASLFLFGSGMVGLVGMGRKKLSLNQGLAGI